MLTKHFYDQEQDDIREFLGFTFRELLNKFLGGRFATTSSLKLKLFQTVFEQCPCLGWMVIKTVIKCFLQKEKTENSSAVDNPEAIDKPATKEVQEGSRSQHQRL